jgi:hypothetical protein
MLLLPACAPPTTLVVAPAELDLADSGDPSPGASDSAVDSGGEIDTGPTIPGADPLGKLTMAPDGIAFLDDVEVTLSIDGAGSAEWCTADVGDRECDWQPYREPIQLGRSTVLHARAVLGDQVSGDHARFFLELDDELQDFESRLPVMMTWTDEARPESSYDTPMGIVMVEPPAGAPTRLTDAPSASSRMRMHIRGSSSAGWEKRSYDLELWKADADEDRRISLAGMPENGDWILYAPYYFDDALIRNPLAMAISNAVGRYAPRTALVELYVGERSRALSGDDYRGVYVLMEEIEVDPERVDLEPLLPEDVDEPEVTGGYLFKIDRTGSGEGGFYAGSAGGEYEFQQNFVAVEPGEFDLEREQSQYLAGRVDEVGWAVRGGDYASVMDVGSFIDHHIINVVMKNPDAFRLSGYFYQDREGLLEAGPVWDFDRTAGSADYRSYDPTWWDNSNETSDCTFVFAFGWYEGLFEDPEFAAAYWARFSEVLDAELSSDALDTMIDGFVENLDAAARRNRSRWGSAEFESEVSKLRDWMRTRHAWMRACIDTYDDPRDCPGG